MACLQKNEYANNNFQMTYKRISTKQIILIVPKNREKNLLVNKI